MDRVAYYNQQNGEITYGTVNVDGRLDIVQHSHPNSVDLHLDTDISTTDEWILVDISNPDYTHQNGDNYVHLEGIYISVDADNTADYSIQIGYLENVGATQGTFRYLYTLSGDKQAGNSKEMFLDLYPNGARMTGEYIVTNIGVTEATFSNTSTMKSTLSPLISDINPGENDVVVRCIINTGTINLSLNMSYHTH